MNSRISLFVVLVLSMAFLLGGCSAAKVTHTWEKEGYSGKLNSMLVIGVAGPGGQREIFEASITDALQERGVRAIPSYTVFSNKELVKEKVVAFLKKEKIEAVIVTKVLNSQELNQRVTYVTESSYGNPFYRSYNGWYDDYYFNNRSVTSYDTNYTISNLETNVYIHKDEDMILSILTELETTFSDKSGVKDLADKIVKELVKDGLI
ncbi:MAG: hypothetical protein KAG92_03010 [Deltaproteobacteria bacterium]|nr:hypothetical protein [Deltaproteobacteria bacterium]